MNTLYAILTFSGAHHGYSAIGSGLTEQEAWTAAYGPSCNGRKPDHVENSFSLLVTKDELESYLRDDLIVD